MELKNTAPNVSDSANFNLTGYNSAEYYKNLAKPYVLDKSKRIVESELETYFGTAAGLMSSAVDMANYSIAIFNNFLIDTKTQNEAFTPTISTGNVTLPYGLGWFVQNYKGIKLVWHYGLWNTNSSLIILVPEKEISFVILANSNNLSLPFQLGAGNLLTSPFAMDFILEFISP